MYLSKLEIFGFKSFAQKTKLKFNEGISCVIGPNGSGKSNIVDAIRWVLGEQRVTNLRSDKMEELIFNGTNNRKPLGMAEVSLTVQNNKSVLSTPYSEVMISRRLYRSGESQYMINKAACRLKDVTGLFMDTGMGANSYSVIELSMVESIISDNPFERRHLFEEAAGVTKYKARRKSALRKLELTRQDMSRISDLISEIKRTVNSLSRQVGKARRYLQFKGELKKTEIDVARYRYSKLTDAIQPLKTQLDEISLIKEDASHQITLEEALLEEYKREIIQIEQNLSTHNKKIQDFDTEFNRIKEEEAVAQTRIQSLTETKHRNKVDIEEYEEKINQLNIDLSENQKKYNNLESNLIELQKNYKKEEIEYNNSRILIEKEKQDIDNLNSKYKKYHEQLSFKKEIAQQKDYLIKWNGDQIKYLEIEQKKYSDSNEQISQKLNEVNQTKDKFTEESSSTLIEIENIKKDLKQLEYKIQEKLEKIHNISSQKESISAQLIFLEQLISKFEGHAKSTQHLMLNKSNYRGLHGPLSELLKIDNKFKIAVETALGEAVNYIVVDNVENAKNILRLVQNENLGRVTLLPLDRINTIKIDNKKIDGNFSRLSELITCHKEYQKIFHLLLGDFIVADNLDEALSESKKYPNFHFVTLDGESINRSGTISGGSKQDSKASLIGRNEQMDILKKELSHLEDEAINLHDEQSLLQKEKDSKQSNLLESEQKKEQLLKRLTDIDKEESKLQYEKQSQTELLEKSMEGIKKMQTNLTNLESELHDINEEINTKNPELSKIEQESDQATKAYESKNLELQALSDKLQKLNLDLVTEQNRYSNCHAEIERFEQTIIDLKSLSTKRKKEIDEIDQQCKSIENEKIQRASRQKHIWDERDQIESSTEEIQQSYHEIKDKILHLEEQIKRYRKQHDNSLERSRQLELQIQENQLKADTLIDQIKNKYGEDITTGIAYEGLNLEESEQNVETLNYKIEQLGQVNPLAVSEYEKESERLEFFTKQYDDLNDAEKLLLETINKINVTARKQFLDTFNKINENFKKVFNNFFAKGDGFLKMEDSKDPLESNIEIFVRPKGKRVQTISLLSGGEKTLTAISLLFSIYLVKPSPFCILDEIDAPLDDVNIDRFTQALSEFSKETQFLVVTHNKRTMESANTLYGVTMEEEGLSKLVSVKFN